MYTNYNTSGRSKLPNKTQATFSSGNIMTKSIIYLSVPLVLDNQQVTHVCDLHWDHFICYNHFQSPNQPRLDLSQQL